MTRVPSIVRHWRGLAEGYRHVTRFAPIWLTGALAVMAIVLVQGAGVAQSAPNSGGAPSDSNRDFAAQGIANVASSLVQGQPVGGSVGQTALNVASGARTRWAGIFCGVLMLLILLAFSGVIGAVAQPTLAGLLIVAGIGSIRPQYIASILPTGTISRVDFGGDIDRDAPASRGGCGWCKESPCR